MVEALAPGGIEEALRPKSWRRMVRGLGGGSGVLKACACGGILKDVPLSLVEKGIAGAGIEKDIMETRDDDGSRYLILPYYTICFLRKWC